MAESAAATTAAAAGSAADGGGGGGGGGSAGGEGGGGGGSGGDATAAAAAAAGGSEGITAEQRATFRKTTDRPLTKLTVHLIDTYKHINQVYYEEKARRLRAKGRQVRPGGVHNDGFDDANYDYIISGDEIIQDRYILKHRLGKGSFGQVICAYDNVRGHEVALKIIKSRKPFMVQAQTEISILERMRDIEGEDNSHIVQLLDHFVYRNHQCLVFEMLSYNLYDLLKNTNFKGVSLNLVRKFGVQLLAALSFLSVSNVDVIHCDLKPENILLRHPRRSQIKVIDFGSSCRSNKRMYSYIQSRFYRSPEVLLGLPYSYPIDVWSCGCVLVEMHTGEPLFSGVDQVDQMYKITQVLGYPPESMLERSPARVRQQFFDKLDDTGATVDESSSADSKSAGGGSSSSSGSGSGSDAPASATRWRVKQSRSSRAARRARPSRTLAQILGVETGGPGGRRLNESGHSQETYGLFLDLITRMLQYDPARRISAAEASQHPFILALQASTTKEMSGCNIPRAGENAASGSGTSAGGDGGGKAGADDEDIPSEAPNKSAGSSTATGSAAPATSGHRDGRPADPAASGVAGTNDRGGATVGAVASRTRGASAAAAAAAAAATSGSSASAAGGTSPRSRPGSNSSTGSGTGGGSRRSNRHRSGNTESGSGAGLSSNAAAATAVGSSR